jgi:hypothetical protein
MIRLFQGIVVEPRNVKRIKCLQPEGPGASRGFFFVFSIFITDIYLLII